MDYCFNRRYVINVLHSAIIVPFVVRNSTITKKSAAKGVGCMFETSWFFYILFCFYEIIPAIILLCFLHIFFYSQVYLNVLFYIYFIHYELFYIYNCYFYSHCTKMIFVFNGKKYNVFSWTWLIISNCDRHCWVRVADRTRQG